MKRFLSSIGTATLLSGCLLIGLAISGCGGGDNFDTDEPYTEAEGEELEAMEESPGEQAN